MSLNTTIQIISNQEIFLGIVYYEHVVTKLDKLQRCNISKPFINYLVNKSFCDDLIPNMKKLARSIFVPLENTND